MADTEQQHSGDFEEFEDFELDAPVPSPAGDDAGELTTEFAANDLHAVADFGAVEGDAFLVGTTAAKRLQVPSQREIDLGVADYEFRPAPPVPKPPRKTFKERAQLYWEGIDPRRIEGSKLPVTLLAMTALTTGLDDAALGLLLPEMFADFKFNLQFMITLGTVFGIMHTMLAPLMGYLADRVSRVWMMRIGEIMTNCGSLVRGFSGAASHLVGGELLRGLGGSLQGPASFPLLADYYRSSARARVIAFLTFAGTLGGLVTPLIIGNLAATVGWRATVISTSGFALVMSSLLFLLKEPIRGYWDRIEMGASEETAQSEQRAVGWGEGWRAAWSIQTIRKLCYATPVNTVAGLIGLFMGLYFAGEFGLGPRARAVLQTVGAIVGLIGLTIGAPLADRLTSYKPGRLVALNAVIITIGGLSNMLLAVSPSLWLSIGISMPLHFVTAMLAPAGIVIATLVIPPRVRGLGVQVLAPFGLIGLILQPIIFAALGGKSIRLQIFTLAPLQFIAAYIVGSIATGIERDIRAAKASSMADEEARRARTSGRNKMIVSRDVDVTYDGTQVLFNVDFDVEEGEIVAMLGTNGAGKSTLLRAISGIQEASNGAIFLDGQDITHVPPHQNASNGIVMVPGGHAIFPTLTVAENLRTAAWLYRDEEEYIRSRTEEVLDFFPRLRERLDTKAGNMSGGEQQMLALGQAFLMRPRILMIDELSLGLAPQVVEMLLDIVRAINAQGTTILLVEQSINVALTVAKRCVFMEKGEIRFDGPTEELLRRPDILRSVFIGGAAAGMAGAGATGIGGRGRRSIEREVVLDVKDVVVEYGGVRALDEAYVEIAAGEIVGMIGPNGSGKTTLFDVISGFVAEPALKSSTVMLQNIDVSDMKPDGRARTGLGRSFQNARLFPSLTVRENIAVAFERHIPLKNPIGGALWLPKVRKAELKTFRRADALIHSLHLNAFADKFVNELSTGTRRVVDIAMIMASDPQVLLLDEPSGGLAQAEVEELGPRLQELVRDTGVAMIIIDHDWNMMCSISDKMYAMELGKVIKVGTPDEVVNDPAVIEAYLGSSTTTLARSGSSRTIDTSSSFLERALEARHALDGPQRSWLEGELETDILDEEGNVIGSTLVDAEEEIVAEPAAPKTRKKAATAKTAGTSKKTAAANTSKTTSGTKKAAASKSRSNTKVR